MVTAVFEMVHELRTPLHTMTLAMELLNASVEISEYHRNVLSDALVSAEFMKMTLSQIMDVGKFQAGVELSPRKSVVKLSSILMKIDVLMHEYGKKVPVSYHVANDVADTVITDEEWLWQMLFNFLTNACRNSDEGQEEIKVFISLASNGNKHINFEKVSCEQKYSNLCASAGDTPQMLQFEVISKGCVDFEKDCASNEVPDLKPLNLNVQATKLRLRGLGGHSGYFRTDTNSTDEGSDSLHCVQWFIVPYEEFIEPADCLIPSTDNLKSRRYMDSRDGSVSMDHSRGALSICNNSSISSSHFSSLMEVSKARPEAMILEQLSTDHSMLRVQTDTKRKVESTKTVSSPHLAFQDPYRQAVGDVCNDHTGIGVKDEIVSYRERDLKIALANEGQRGMTAIVVDDVLMIRKCMQRVLRQAGFSKVICCENGKKGLEAMQQEEVDVVFADVQMPIMSGPEMARKFREFEAEALRTGKRQHRQHIVAVTANDTELYKRSPTEPSSSSSSAVPEDSCSSSSSCADAASAAAVAAAVETIATSPVQDSCTPGCITPHGHYPGHPLDNIRSTIADCSPSIYAHNYDSSDVSERFSPSASTVDPSSSSHETNIRPADTFSPASLTGQVVKRHHHTSTRVYTEEHVFDLVLSKPLSLNILQAAIVGCCRRS